MLSEDLQTARAEATTALLNGLAKAITQLVEDKKYEQAAEVGSTLGGFIANTYQLELMDGITDETRKLARKIGNKNLNLGDLD